MFPMSVLIIGTYDENGVPSVGDVYDPRYNKIEVIRRNIIDSMGNDIGLN